MFVAVLLAATCLADERAIDVVMQFDWENVEHVRRNRPGFDAIDEDVVGAGFDVKSHDAPKPR
jgi:hypothetical protein